ncbi:peptidoglycan D,D-transpeptidase FtsI family protein [Nonomuraea sediminis]|uniref:peptidoglycan D,D-transpeptidase FtsI family protein n=1 Tax=Nonomuraea sediminis TaxID=2835864 RepID=UPI001BDD1863|nr:penicillin-binding protein 2 [Nonomuraea sediminis]
MAGPRARRINIPLRRVALLCSVMLFVALGNITYIQAFGSQSLNADARNQRTLIARFDHPRGDITTRDGTVIATSRRTGGEPYEYRREYPEGAMYAPVTGYASLYSTTGIERAEDSVLSGDEPRVRVHSLVRKGSLQGGTVRLTIDARAQRAAYEGLAATGKPGAAVAINPLTGAILAMASYPSYDPNLYATLDGHQLFSNDARLRSDPAQPLLNRALNQTYPPGSTFKIVTAAAALTTGEYAPGDRVDGPRRLPLPGSAAIIHGGCGGRPLAYALQVSCNTAFAGIGLELGQDTLRDQAEAFGFNVDDLAVPLPVSRSDFPAGMDRAQTAMSAIGQYDDRATPLMIAMLSAAVANGGLLMQPYLVEEVRLADGSIVSRAQPSEYRTATTADIADQLTDMMVAVTHPGGTGAAVAIPGIDVAAKTGTATDTPHAPTLFTAFAPADAPEVAIGIALENATPATTTPLARHLLESLLN